MIGLHLLLYCTANLVAFLVRASPVPEIDDLDYYQNSAGVSEPSSVIHSTDSQDEIHSLQDPPYFNPAFVDTISSARHHDDLPTFQRYQKSSLLKNKRSNEILDTQRDPLKRNELDARFFDNLLANKSIADNFPILNNLFNQKNKPKFMNGWTDVQQVTQNNYNAYDNVHFGGIAPNQIPRSTQNRLKFTPKFMDGWSNVNQVSQNNYNAYDNSIFKDDGGLTGNFGRSEAQTASANIDVGNRRFNDVNTNFHKFYPNYNLKNIHGYPQNILITI